jgi:hypothetical protein
MQPPPSLSKEWYLKSPQRKSLSSATAKRLKEDIAVMSCHSSDPKDNDWNPVGKTPDEIAAWCTEYERGQRSEMAKRSRLGF